MMSAAHQGILQGSGGRATISSLAVFIYSSLIAFACFRIWCVWSGRIVPFDDAYIVFRVAENFAAGRGLVFNSGEAVQVSTSALYALLLGAAHGLTGIKPAAFAIAVSLLCAFVSLAAIYHLYALTSRDPASTEAKVGGLVCAGLYAFIPVSVLADHGGLETPLYSLAILLTFVALARNQAGLTALCCVTCAIIRVDGLLVAMVALPAFVLMNRTFPVRAVLVSAAAIVAYYVAIYGYYGDIVPNTAHAKDNLARDVWRQSEIFVTKFFTADPARVVLGVLYLIGLGAALAKRDRALPFLLFGLLYAFTVTIKAMWWEWYYQPFAITYVLGVARGVQVLTETAGRMTDRVPQAIASGALGVVLMAGLAWHALAMPVAQIANVQSALLKQRQAVAQWINTRSEPSATVMLEPLGLIGYHTNRTIHDYPGLASTAVVQALRANGRKIGGNPQDVEGFRIAAAAAKPDYLVLRRAELTANVGSGWLSERYRLVETFPIDPAITRRHRDLQDLFVLKIVERAHP